MLEVPEPPESAAVSALGNFSGIHEFKPVKLFSDGSGGNLRRDPRLRKWAGLGVPSIRGHTRPNPLS